MRIVTTFDPNAKTTDTFNLELPGPRGKMLVFNESNWSLQLTFSNNATTYVPAWTAMLYPISNLSTSIVTWKQLTQLASSGSPISQVIIETYDQNETVPGTYPAALVRQTNIGNSVTTSSGSVAQLINDGNTSQQIIEATVAGDGASAVTLTNDAVMVLGDVAHPGSLTAKGTITADGAGVGLAVTNNETVGGTLEVLGAADLDSTLDVSGASTLDSGGAHTVTTDGSGNLTVGGTLAVTGIQTFTGATEILGAADLDSTLDVSGASTLDSGGAHTVTTDGAGRLTINGAGTGLTVTNDALVSGNLTVTGTEGLTGILTAAAANVLGTAGNQQHILGTLLVDQAASFSAAINPNTPVTTITGGTNGTCDCYQPLQGTIKIVVLILKSFRTGGSTQDYTLPTAFTTKGFFLAGDCDTFTFMNGGVGQNVDVITSSGNSNNQGTVTGNTFGGITHPFDTIRFSASAGSNHNSIVIVIGV
jgi:hypothetical protein